MLKKFLSLFFTICVGTGMGLVYVSEKVEPVELSYKIRAKEKSLAEQYDTVKNLKFRLATLKSPSRLETQMLDSKLELVPVREVRVLKFTKKILPVPQPTFMGTEPPIHGGFLAVREAQAKTDDKS